MARSKASRDSFSFVVSFEQAIERRRETDGEGTRLECEGLFQRICFGYLVGGDRNIGFHQRVIAEPEPVGRLKALLFELSRLALEVGHQGYVVVLYCVALAS